MTHWRDDVARAGRPNLNQTLLSLEDEGRPPLSRPSRSGVWAAVVALLVVGLVVWYMRSPTSWSGGGASPSSNDAVSDDEHECAYRAALRDMESQIDQCLSERDRYRSKLSECESDLDSCELLVR
jgi:hypothetical protein